MFKHFFLVMALAFAVVSTSVGVAAPGKSKTSSAPKPTAAKPAANSTSAAAKADLAHVASVFKAAQSLCYTSTITMPGSSGATETIDANVAIERPNLVQVKLSKAGKLIGLAVSDGKQAYGYDPIQNRYTKTAAAADSGNASIEEALAGAAQIVSPDASSAMLSPGVVMFLSPSNFDLTSREVPGHLTVTDKQAVLDGAPVSHISEQVSSNEASVTLHLYLDKSTGLPKRFAEDITRNGTSMEVIREDFGKIDLGKSSQEAANFAWTPPADAKLFTPPSPQDQDKPALADGAVAPDFSAQDTGGNAIHLSDYKGKVVVLDFWATWCGPCQMSLPHTDTIAKSYTGKGVVFLPICSWDDKSSFQTWVKAHKAMSMHFYFDPAAKDETGSIANKLYGVDGIPTQYVIGKDGKVVSGFVGYDEQGDPKEMQLQKVLDKALAAS